MICLCNIDDGQRLSINNSLKQVLKYINIIVYIEYIRINVKGHYR